MVSIDEFKRKLSAIPEKEFTHEGVLDFLQKHPVDIHSLNPFMFFCDEHYTRNLLHKTPLFELIAICWEVGQKSPIHNHRDQRCWMAMAHGKLQVHNFAMVQKDSGRSFCELRSSGQFYMDREHPTEVNPTEPIHQVLNLPSYQEKAVSLHIYSLPFDTCEVYDLKAKTYEDVKLVNTTEFGVVKQTDMKLERVTF